MDIEIECEDSSYINQMSDGANNQGTSNLSVKNYIGQNQDDYTTFTCCTMTGETQSYLTGNVNIRGEDDSSYVALGSCKGCIFEGKVVCEGNGSFVVGAERGSDNMVLADLTAKGTEYPSTGTVRGISMEENSILIGKCVASGGCGVLDSSTGCAASVSVETKYCTIISWECQNCAVVGSAVADSIDPFASNAVNGYVGMDLIIRNTNFFIVGGENCLFEGSVDLFTEYQWARVESDVPVIVHLPDGKEWNTANGSLYRHDDYYGFPCAEGHALYDVFPYDHYGICVEVAGANSSELPEITDQWPEHMQPDSGEEEPEDGVIQLSLYETADCDESTRIRSMVYSCGNFSWDRTVGTDETDQTNYGTCYLKIQRKGMHEDMILERAELTAPDGFSFSSREMVKTKTINLAAILSGEHVITLYPIYTETEPTAKSVEFLVNGQTFSTGTELKVNPDAGKLYMRSSFDTSGESSWDDIMKPDFGALRNPSMLYDRGLAQISAAFSGAVYKYEDIYKTLLNFGFSNIQRYNYNPDNDQVVTDMGRHMVAATFATKKVLVEGKVKTLAAVVVRGTVSEEWFGNFDIGTGDRHRGFEMARGYLAPSLFQYLNDHTDTPAETKILITGHSRGAAVANLIAADLNNKYRSVFAEQEDIYTYTFATPNSTSSANDHCSNVFNIINPKDVVTEIPSGFHKVGTDYRIAWPGSQPYFTQVIEKYRELTKGSEEFKEWGLEYAALAKGMRVISHASDLPWGATKVTLEAVGTIAGTVIKWRVVDKTLLEYVKTTFHKDLDFVPLNASILIDYMLKSMEWYRGNDIYDLRTTGDLAAAMLLYADAPEPEGVADKLWAWVQQYAMDRIWCNHAMEFYYSWMVTAPATAVDGVEPVEHPYCVATIRCPVDVNVYNEAGELVASIVNDQVVTGAGETCSVLGDEKYFVLEGTNHRFEITGYDAGLVDISVTQYSEIFEKLSVSVFSDLTVQKGETLTMHYNRLEEEADAQCYVISAAGETYYPETKTSEEMEHHPIQVEVNGTGTVSGGGTCEVGEMVILTASEAENFLGWYENGSLLSTEPEYVFVCEGPRTVTAMFLDGTQEHVHAYTETVTAPTCTEKGYTTYTCDCGDSYTGNEVPVLDHRYVAGTCQLCGAADVSFVPGDVDGDGVLSYNDALTVLRGSIGLAVLTPQQERIADFDGDGGISYNDALMILRASIGL